MEVMMDSKFQSLEDLVSPAGMSSKKASAHIPNFSMVSFDQIDLSAHSLPRRSVENYLLRTVMELVERPWAPAPEDRPMRLSPEVFGNSSIPFRKETLDSEARSYRQSMVQEIVKTSTKERISRWSHVYKYHVHVDNLPANFDGFRILHLSDIHFQLGNRHIVDEIGRLVDWLNIEKKKIDFIVLTGDVLTYGIKDLDDDALNVLNLLRGKVDHAFFVSGNHDYHGMKNQLFREMMEQVGYQNLDNKHAGINIGEQSINIYGIDDAIHGRPKVPALVCSGPGSILITHNLDGIRANCPDCFDLILSGHSHWGELKYFNGLNFMKLWGYAQDINEHSRSWDVLTDRALSYVHPGLARHYVGVPGLRQPTGFAIHTLTR